MECMFYEIIGSNRVKCNLCPRHCIIPDGKRGNCRVRENRAGKLYSLVYGKPCSVAIDPIEKKPLYHFMPGSRVYSLGTAGCNLHCNFCQNWTTSQAKPEEVETISLSPKEAVDEAEKNGCNLIAYTYNEPIVFYEYVIDCAKEAKKRGIRNIMVSNGFINPEPLKELCRHIDAINIDLKGFTENFYKEYTTASLEPVLETIKTIKKKGLWLELTNLIIPGANDDINEIRNMCRWIKENIGGDTPLHFSAFRPCYKLNDRQATSKDILNKAKNIAIETGLKYVYLGNVDADNNTYCPECGKLLIKRGWFEAVENNLEKGKCDCGFKIDGIW